MAAILQGLETVYKVCILDNQRRDANQDEMSTEDKNKILLEGLIVSKDNIVRASEICKYSDAIAIKLNDFLKSK